MKILILPDTTSRVMIFISHDVPECLCLAGFRIRPGILQGAATFHLVLLNSAMHPFMRSGRAVVISECREGMRRGIFLHEVLGKLDLRITG